MDQEMANNSSTFIKITLDNGAEMILWIVIYLVESFLICLGNSLSIVVFWRRRRSLRRTSYLLINLAVADLILGVSMAILAIKALWSWNTRISSIIMSINTFPMFASIFSLTVVSLETAYAIVFPFRHRTAGGRAYCFAVTLIWLLAALNCVMWTILCIFNFRFLVVPLDYFAVVISGICLILMSSSYISIWWFVSKRRNRQTRERKKRKKLAVTLLVLTLLSLMSWIPGQLAFLTHFVQALHFKDARYKLLAVLLVNSCLNPLVYTFRMPEFRREIKAIICRLTTCC